MRSPARLRSQELRRGSSKPSAETVQRSTPSDRHERAALVGLFNAARPVSSIPNTRSTSWPAWPRPPAPTVVLRVLQERAAARSGDVPRQRQGRVAGRGVRRAARRHRHLRQRADARRSCATSRRRSVARSSIARSSSSTSSRAARARAKGKLQVELAQLKYLLPRLVGSATRCRGSAAASARAAPARRSSRPIAGASAIASACCRRRSTPSAAAARSCASAASKAAVPTVALVGYTNAGKTTLFNALTGDDAVASDALFVTLDPLVRKVRLPDRRELLVSDTVGFIDRLPHSLVAAFRATLEEVAAADLLLHVIDASNPDRERQMAAVRSVLAEVGADDVPVDRRVQQVRSARRRGARAAARALSGRAARLGADRRGPRRAHRRDGGAARARHRAVHARVRRLVDDDRARIAPLYRVGRDPAPRVVGRPGARSRRRCRGASLDRFPRQRSAGVMTTRSCRRCSACSLLSAACGADGRRAAAAAGGRLAEVSGLRVPGRRRRSRDAGGAASGTRPAGSGCRPATCAAAERRLHGRAEAARRLLSGRGRPRLRRARAEGPRRGRRRTSIARVAANPRVRAGARRAAARRCSRSASATRRSRASRRRSRPTRRSARCAAASRCCASAASRTMSPRRARRPRPAGSPRRAAVYDAGDRRLARQPVPLSRARRRRAPRRATLDAALAPRAARRSSSSRPTPRARPPRRDLRGAEGCGEGRGRVRRGAGARAERGARAQGRRAARQAGVRGDARRSSRPSRVADAVARAARRAPRRAPRGALQARAAAERGRDHRHARQLGAPVDPVGHARRRDGGLPEPHVPADGHRPPRRSGARRRAACSRSSRPAIRRSPSSWRNAPRQFTDLPPGAPQLSRRIRGRRGRRHAAARGRELSAVAAVTGAEAVAAVKKLEELAGSAKR